MKRSAFWFTGVRKPDWVNSSETKLPDQCLRVLGHISGSEKLKTLLWHVVPSFRLVSLAIHRSPQIRKRKKPP